MGTEELRGSLRLMWADGWLEEQLYISVRLRRRRRVMRAAVHFSEASNSCKGDESFVVHHSRTRTKLANLLLRHCLCATLC
jgi:hypothetical protein